MSAGAATPPVRRRWARTPPLSRVGARTVLIRGSMLLVLAVCVGYGITNVVWAATDWQLPDVDAYWGAATRLAAGEALYPPVPDVNAPDVYRYAPWFAIAWMPLTLLPRPVVDGLWSAALIAASLAVVLPVLWRRRRASTAFAALLGGFLVLIASRGNVQPLMVAALAFGVERRSGPIWIAACASLKATPIFFVMVYVIRGEWRRAALTMALTAVLVLPMLAFGIKDYPTDPGSSSSLYALSPALYWLVALSSVVVGSYIAWRHRRWAWLAAAVAVILCLPRFFPYEFTFLFVGLIPVADAWRERRVGREPA